MYHREQLWGNSFQISRSCSLKVRWGCMLIISIEFIFLVGQSCSRTHFTLSKLKKNIIFADWAIRWKLKFNISSLSSLQADNQVSVSLAMRRNGQQHHPMRLIGPCSVQCHCFSLFFLFQQASSTTAPPIKEQWRSVPLVTALGVCGGGIIAFMSGCIVAFLYRRARRNHGVAVIECNRTS